MIQTAPRTHRPHSMQLQQFVTAWPVPFVVALLGIVASLVQILAWRWYDTGDRDRCATTGAAPSELRSRAHLRLAAGAVGRGVGAEGRGRGRRPRSTFAAGDRPVVHRTGPTRAPTAPPPEAHERAAVDSSRAQLLVESTLRRHRIIVSEDSVAGREVAQLDAVLRDVRVALGVELANARARIDADSLPSVLGDRNALARVFQKLVENGLKHAALGSVPRIRVSASVIGQRCEIEVRDWGVGIALDQQERVFARYEGYEGSPANRRPQRSSLD